MDMDTSVPVPSPGAQSSDGYASKAKRANKACLNCRKRKSKCLLYEPYKPSSEPTLAQTRLEDNQLTLLSLFGLGTKEETRRHASAAVAKTLSASSADRIGAVGESAGSL